MTEETMAFVLINADVGFEGYLVKDLKKLSPVNETYIEGNPESVYGVYDIILKLKGKNMGGIKEYVTEKIRTLDYVRSTLTMIVTGPSFERQE
jgi:DNA-binding Lrp family transcriptional regulator